MTALRSALQRKTASTSAVSRAPGGSRTHTPLRASAFETEASASSATGACCSYLQVKRPAFHQFSPQILFITSRPSSRHDFFGSLSWNPLWACLT